MSYCHGGGNQFEEHVGAGQLLKWPGFVHRLLDAHSGRSLVSSAKADRTMRLVILATLVTSLILNPASMQS